MFYELARKALFSTDPETAHELTLEGLRLGHRLGATRLLCRTRLQPVTCMGLQFPNPVGVAPGLDKNGDYFEALANRNLSLLKVRSGLSGDELIQALELIRHCSPNPGENFSGGDNQYVTPDVIVRREKNRWIVEANPDTMPRLRINSYYTSLIKRGDQSQDNQMMRDHLQEARWLMSSLELRNQTLLRVSQAIVDFQEGFLEQGELAMKPLVLRDVADSIGVHESTVSRATTRTAVPTIVSHEAKLMPIAGCSPPWHPALAHPSRSVASTPGSGGSVAPSQKSTSGHLSGCGSSGSLTDVPVRKPTASGASRGAPSTALMPVKSPSSSGA